MLLKRLTEASGVSGNENEVRDLIIEEIKGYADDIKIDNIGNLIIYKEGKNKDFNKTLLLAAHMDEVGLMVKDIDEKGLLKFYTVGGIDKRVLVSKSVLVGDNKIPGVIGAKPIHLQKPNERKIALDIDELYIDIGAIDKEDAMKDISIGDYVTFSTEYKEFGNDMIKAKALDDRVGCNILIDMIKEFNDISFYAVFTTMEEIGLRGAGPAAYQIDPDYSIIVEGTLCYDISGLDRHKMPTKIGDGPAISLMDRTTIYNSKIREKIEKIAKNNDIDYQYRRSSLGGNDSGEIHTIRDGSLTTTISVPCRYIHAPSSVMNKKDYENTYKLIYLVASEYGKGEI